MEKDEKIELMLELREQEGLNRKEFALKYGIPYPTITDWEMGHRRIPEYFLRLLAYKVGLESLKKVDYKISLAEQLAVDYCCTPEDVGDNQNHFTEFSKADGQRVFDSIDNPVLKITVVNDKLLFTGRADVIAICKEKYMGETGQWFMDVHNFRAIEDIIKPLGHRIKTVHPFFLPADARVTTGDELDLILYSRDEIEQFRGDDRFDEAFCFDEAAPDMIAVAACKDGKMLGMAGASADSPTFWQIGINVFPEAEHNHVATALVSKIKYEIIKLGKVPYYGTSISNLASQRVALNSGFKPAWVELLSEGI